MEMPRKNSILRINDEKTLELIRLYEKEECLWNTDLSSYKNRAKRVAATERIAKKLAIENFDARLVATKFKNLRNSYCQELKKMACGDCDKPRVWWFSKMDAFLRPHLQSTGPWDLKSVKQEDKRETYLEDKEDDLVQMSDPEEILVESQSEEKPQLRKKRSRVKSKSRKKTDGEEHIKSSDITSTNECFDNFGKYVASMLKTMPKQKAMKLQPKIVTLLTLVNSDTSEGEGESHTWE